MKESHTFLVPDYFPHFACKMGACRTACCTGWPVTISRENYFHLLGVECSPDLRRRLDCALHLVDYPTPDEYARFSHRYDGECAARLPDGRCAIQAELGEDLLADVCRLYPRGVRVEERDGHECSCANSCEAVIEVFLDHPAPLTFVEHPMTIKLPHPPEREAHFETFGRAREIRLYLIRTMQNRALTLPKRLAHLGQVLWALERVMSDHDEAGLAAILGGSVVVSAVPETTLSRDSLLDGLHIAEEMIALLDARSDSIRDWGEAALAYFGRDDGALDRYIAARDGFAACFPAWEVYFEHMLVNHMYFAQFPFQDRPETVGDEFIALCAVYALLRFLLLGTAPTDETALVDIAAAFFRLVEHSSFDRSAARLLKQVGCTTPEQMWELISL